MRSRWRLLGVQGSPVPGSSCFGWVRYVSDDLLALAVWVHWVCLYRPVLYGLDDWFEFGSFAG